MRFAARRWAGVNVVVLNLPHAGPGLLEPLAEALIRSGSAR